MCGRIPVLPRNQALVVAVVNILCPGGGALIASALEDFRGDLICIAIFQFLLAFLIIGWVWAIIWGLRVLSHSSPEHMQGGAAAAAAAAPPATHVDVHNGNGKHHAGPTPPPAAAQHAPVAQGFPPVQQHVQPGGYPAQAGPAAPSPPPAYNPNYS